MLPAGADVTGGFEVVLGGFVVVVGVVGVVVGLDGGGLDGVPEPP